MSGLDCSDREEYEHIKSACFQIYSFLPWIFESIQNVSIALYFCETKEGQGA